MRTLVVAEQYPWPATDGYRQRLHHLIAGLAEVSTVDVVSLDRSGAAEVAPSPLDGVDRAIAAPGSETGIRTWGPVWLRSSAPRRVLGPVWDDARQALRDLLAEQGAPDLVWFSHVDTWWPMHDLVAGVPSIVDFDNLENLALRLRRRTPPRFAPGADLTDRLKGTARWATSRAFDVVDEGRWDRLQRSVANQVDRVVVCSELDAVRSGCANAVVVPNGADPAPGAHTDRTRLRGEDPTMLFVGALDYEPNTEAVEWFVREVLPLVKARAPRARVRIVGRGGEGLSWVAEVPGVDLVGAVPEIADELAATDISIVPIRVGAGTRLKVVEALANHLPLV
ncbi:MAG: glycosyltransferase family 4 protein, partial [Actinomycetota bacterium]|nr:glycosyltransferase family 4 protein [Actinomycetota bacterium]